MVVEHVNLDLALQEIAVNGATDYQEVMEDLIENVSLVGKEGCKIHLIDRNAEEPSYLHTN